jgi:hypothetical protein
MDGNNIIPTAAKYQSFFSVLSALVGAAWRKRGNRNFHAKPSPKEGVRMNVFEEKRAVRRKHNKKRLIWFVFRVENQVRGRLRVTLMGFKVGKHNPKAEFRKIPWKATSQSKLSETMKNFYDSKNGFDEIFIVGVRESRRENMKPNKTGSELH